MKAKSELKAKVTTLLIDLKIAGVNVKFIRRNDSGENKPLFEKCRSKGYGIKFEFLVLKLPSEMANLKESFRPSLGKLELC